MVDLVAEEVSGKVRHRYMYEDLSPMLTCSYYISEAPVLWALYAFKFRGLWSKNQRKCGTE